MTPMIRPRTLLDKLHDALSPLLDPPQTSTPEDEYLARMGLTIDSHSNI